MTTLPRWFQWLLLGQSLLWAAGCTRSTPPAPPAPDRLVVSLLAPGVGSEEVEAQILRVLEEALAKLPEVAALEGEAREGQASLGILLAPGAQPYEAAQAARELLASALGSLPEAAEAPVLQVLPGAANAGQAWLLRAERLSPAELRELQDRVVRTRLEAVAGVRRVESCGGMLPEVRIELDPLRLQALGVRLDEVQAALLALGVDLPGGASPQRTGLDQLGELVVQRHEDAPIHLRDLAQIIHSPQPTGCLARQDGGWVVLGEAQLAAGASPDPVRSALADLPRALPPGLELRPWSPAEALTLRAEAAPVDDEAGARLLQALDGRLQEAGRTAWLLRLGPAEAPGLPRLLTACWLVPASARPKPPTPEELAALVRELGQVPGIGPAWREGDGTRELALWLSGADRDALEAQARALSARLQGLPGVRAVRLRGLGHAPGLVLRLEHERLAALGVTPAQATQALAAGLSGVEVGRAEPSGAPIRLYLGRGGRRPAEVLELPVAPGVPLGQVARLEQTLAPAVLLRWNQRPAVELRLVVEEAQRAAAFEVATASPLPPGMTLQMP
jgi:multidrug efflux pump subunit AcrB